MQTFRVFVFLFLSACFATAARGSAVIDDSAPADNLAAARSSNSAAPPALKSSSKEHFNVGIGVKVSTLGIGGELALPVTRRSNVRFGFNAFNYNHTFNKDGVPTRALSIYDPLRPFLTFFHSHQVSI